MILKFQQHIRDNQLFKPGARILLAVSGGIDSMVMLHLFSSLKFHIGVAHCNFQLRGAESVGDEEFVRQRCLQDNIPFHFTRFETNNYAIEKGISIQMAARDLRYRWFDQVIDQYQYDVVATAHHLNDSLETSLLNLARGTGFTGVMGIPVRSENRVRPMLAFTRKEIETFAMMNAIAWREDRSNQTTDYQRNFIRHEVVPKFKEVNPSIETAFSNFVLRAQGTRELLEWGMQFWKQKFWKEEGATITISKEGLFAVNHPASVLFEVIRKLGFNIHQCEDVIEALSAQSGKKFYSETHTLLIDRECLVIAPETTVPMETLIYQTDALIQHGNDRLQIMTSDKVELAEGKNVAVLDFDKMNFPLVWRQWRPGDYFFPLGMQHRKKLSDFFIDQKVSVIEKESATVLESGGEIVWVVGYRVDDRYKIAQDTRKVFRAVHTKHH